MSDGASTTELLVRLVFSLGLIVGMLVLAAKVARKNGAVLRLPGFKGRDSAITVVDRQPLSKTASLAVVRVGARTMVVGVTEHGISLLADAPDLVDQPETATAPALADNPSPATAHIAADTTLATAHIAASTPAHEAGWTLPRGTGAAAEAATRPPRPPRMSFVEALREMTVRRV